MKMIPLSQGLITTVSDEDYEYLMQWKWYASYDNGLWRAKRACRKGGKRSSVSLTLEIAQRMGLKAECIDHSDGIPLNNQRDNLRESSVAENTWNQKIASTNRTGIKGVGYQKHLGKYRGRVMKEGRSYATSTFYTVEEAGEAVKILREKLHGKFARHS